VKKFLVATDFSKHADRALAHACALAKLFGADLELFTSAYIPPHLLAAMATGMSPAWIQEARDQATKQLESLQTTLRARGVNASIHLSTDEPSSAICARAEQIGADLIAAGTRGHTGIAHVVFGSVAERVARLAHSPVLTAHEDSPEPDTYRRVLVPTDFSPDADLALAWARVLAEKTGGALIVQHSCDLPVLLAGSPEVDQTSILAAIEKAAREKLASIARSLSGCSVETVVSHGRPDVAILDTAESAKADLIVMGTRGRTGVAHVVLGSTAERVLRRSHLPVVTLKTRPDGK
jgi:nucleotide-binding universal stress UspA family protein